MILKVNLELDKWDLCYVIYMFLSNNPSPGDINSSNLPCCVFVTFPCGVLGQVWYLIVSIPDLCLLSYFDSHFQT